MNTFRYKPEYREQTAELLKNTPNTVNLFTDAFFEVAKLLDGERFDGAKFDKLLARAYTVLAAEGETVVGIASMDKEGNIGILTAAEGEHYSKACNLLLKALDRRALKQELPFLFVSQTELSDELLRKSGYKPYQNGNDVNEFMLVKEFASKPKFDSASVKRMQLDPAKPIAIEGKTAFLPWLWLGLAVFFVLLAALITGFRYGSEYFEEKFSSFVAIWIVCGVFFLCALIFFLGYRIRAVKLKREVLTMQITNGVVVCHTADHYWDLSEEHYYKKTYRERVPERTRHFVTYRYYDENMQSREERYTRRYMGRGSYFYEGQELVVAYSANKSYILRKYTVLRTSDADGKPIEENSVASNASAKPVSERSQSKYVPLLSAKMYDIYALRYSVFFAVAFCVVLLLAYFTARASNTPYSTELLYFLPFLIFITLALGGPSLVFFVRPVYHMRKFRKMAAKPDSKVIIGKFVHGDEVYKSKNGLKFYCEYQDGSQTKRIRVKRKFVAILIKSGKSAAKVIVNGKDAEVLVEKGKYPDVVSFFFPHY